MANEDKKIRVSLVSLAGKGGMHHYIAQLANALEKSSNVHIILPDHLDQRFFESKNITGIPAGNSFNKVLLRSLLPSTYVHIIKAIKSTNPDIVHFTSSHPWNWIIALLIKKPVLYTIHDPKSHSGERFYLKYPELFMRKYIDGAFIHSKKLQKGILSSKIPYFTVPHGRYFFLGGNKSNSSNQKSLLFFGRIEKYKGLEYLLKAFSAIQKKYPEWSLVIAGEGNMHEYTQDIQKITKIKLLNRFIENDEIAQLFSETSCVILPYTDATQSGIPFIAYEHSKPVIATNVGALGDIIEDNKTGLLVKPRDIPELVQAMNYIIKNPEKAEEFGINGCKKIETEFGGAVVADKTMEGYRGILKLNKKNTS